MTEVKLLSESKDMIYENVKKEQENLFENMNTELQILTDSVLRMRESSIWCKRALLYVKMFITDGCACKLVALVTQHAMLALKEFNVNLVVECAQWECEMEALLNPATISAINELVNKIEERIAFQQASERTETGPSDLQAPFKGVHNIECVMLTPQDA